MSDEPSPLQSMGTQSRETMNMAEAMMARDFSRDADVAVGKIGAAASWAIDKAKDGLQSAAEQARDRTSAAVATYTREDPIRAVLIAAGTGALLMVLVGLMARSGVRKVRRSVQ